jgi:hypothetical protein
MEDDLLTKLIMVVYIRVTYKREVDGWLRQIQYVYFMVHCI